MLGVVDRLARILFVADSRVRLFFDLHSAVSLKGFAEELGRCEILRGPPKNSSPNP